MAQQPEKEEGRPAFAADGVNASPDKTASEQSGGQLNTVDILGAPGAHRPAPLRLEQANHQNLPPIGTAEMLSDESVILHLQAESTDGKTHGDGELIIHPNDGNYGSIVQHIGEIQPGEIKFVSPWEDVSGRPTNQGPVKGDVVPQTGTTTPKTGDVAPETGTIVPQAGGVVPQTGGAKSQAGTAGGDAAAAAAAAAPVQDPIVPPSHAFEDGVNKTFNTISPQTKSIIAKRGAKVVAVHHLTDALPELKGVAPRGWPAGATWDAVDGCWSGGKNEIIVAEQRQLIGNGKWVASGRTDQVLRHETGHAVDFTINTMSEHPDYKQAYDADTQALPPADKNQLAYFLQPGGAGRQETAAEGVADREGGATGGITFHKDFPNTLKVINDTINGAVPVVPIAPIAPVVPGVPATPAGHEP
jgi:hypothetical protein